jgi:hypothetical protein
MNPDSDADEKQKVGVVDFSTLDLFHLLQFFVSTRALIRRLMLSVWTSMHTRQSILELQSLQLRLLS